MFARNVVGNVVDNVALNDTDLAVLKLISNNPTISARDIAKKLRKTVRTIQRVQRELKKRRIIKRVGNVKTGHWIISPEKKGR